jgi:cell division septation protein DedD
VTQSASLPPPKPETVETKKPEPAKSAPTSIAALIAEAGPPVPSAPKAASGSGGYRLQLSAVRNADAVAGEWARLKRLYPELARLSNSTTKIDIPGKGTFYRVEAGPLDEAAAKSTCTHLRGQGLGCIVVKR